MSRQLSLFQRHAYLLPFVTAAMLSSCGIKKYFDSRSASVPSAAPEPIQGNLPQEEATETPVDPTPVPADYANCTGLAADEVVEDQTLLQEDIEDICATLALISMSSDVPDLAEAVEF